MSKILTQQEMEALLNHINQNGNESEKVADKTYVKYDFTKKRKIPVDFTDLDFYANKFADDIKSILSTFFVKNMKVKLSSVKSLMLKEIKENLNFPSGIGYCKLIKNEKNFLIVIDDTTAFALVELFFGGISISEKKIEARPFTIIEQRVIKKIYKEIIGALKNKFLEFFNDEGIFINLEMVPKHINIFSDNERLAVFEMDVSMDDFGSSMFFLEDIAGKMYLIFPQDFFIKEKKEFEINESKEENQKINNRLLQSLYDVYLNVRVELCELEMTLGEVINLKPEDVLVLDKCVNQELNVFLEGIPKFKGIHGISKGIHAIKITKKL